MGNRKRKANTQYIAMSQVVVIERKDQSSWQTRQRLKGVKSHKSFWSEKRKLTTFPREIKLFPEPNSDRNVPCKEEAGIPQSHNEQYPYSFKANAETCEKMVPDKV